MNKYSHVNANVDIVTPQDIVHPRRMSSPRENIVTPAKAGVHSSYG